MGARSAIVSVLVFVTATGCTCGGPRRVDRVSVATLLSEMVDLDELAREPEPRFTEALVSSTDPESRPGSEAWFSNDDHDHFVRTETSHGRREDVLADLAGPGTMTRFWTANPASTDRLRFYFDGEAEPRLSCIMAELFAGKVAPIGPAFAYSVAEGGNVYFPLPYARSLEITREASSAPRPDTAPFYYQIGHRTYAPGTRVETFDPAGARSWANVLADTSDALAQPGTRGRWDAWVLRTLTVPPGETRSVVVEGERTVLDWSARVLDTRDTGAWEDPRREHNAYRYVLLDVDFDGEPAIRVPLGDFFGGGPGVNPFETLAFKVEPNGRMTSRLRMPFRRAMALALTNAGKTAYSIDLRLHVERHSFGPRDDYLRAEWGAVTRQSRPPFDMNVLQKSGAGKLVGSVYEIANPVFVWWGEGDQKIFVDGEPSPSTFGTGTEDDYGFGYGSTARFWRPYHAQSRMDGPGNGGLTSMNRLYVLDAIPYRQSIRFDQEVWDWIGSAATFAHVVYWYSPPGSPGPAPVDRASLAPVNLGRPEDTTIFEAETLVTSSTGGTRSVGSWETYPGEQHLAWRGARPGDRLSVHLSVPRAGRYRIELLMVRGPEQGRHRFRVNGRPAAADVDGYSPVTDWLRPDLGVFELDSGDDVLEAEALPPHPDARGDALAIDYVVAVKQ